MKLLHALAHVFGKTKGRVISFRKKEFNGGKIFEQPYVGFLCFGCGQIGGIEKLGGVEEYAIFPERHKSNHPSKMEASH